MTDSPFVDVAFPLAGKSLPLDHGYALFGAVSRIVPKLHAEPRWGLHPVHGLRTGPGLLTLRKTSLLTVRAPVAAMGELLPLAGQPLEVSGHRVSVGIPKVFPLRASARLHARFVTIKSFDKDPGEFEAAARRQLQALGMEAATVTVGARRVVRVSSHTIVGFVVDVGALSAEHSIRLQVEGIGGRRHMGAGLFLPEKA